MTHQPCRFDLFKKLHNLILEFELKAKSTAETVKVARLGAICPKVVRLDAGTS
ncbi:MAG TPA: hypothetical protein V6D50_08245 [Chroococcales cyanobacterium]|jgi:hypothetical protein